MTTHLTRTRPGASWRRAPWSVSLPHRRAAATTTTRRVGSSRRRRQPATTAAESPSHRADVGTASSDTTSPSARRRPAAATRSRSGCSAAITGPSSTGQRTIDKVAAAWETWVNENGGIAGQPVEVVFKDSANDAAKAQAAAKELVEQEQVIAVVLADGTTEDAIGPYLNEQRMPVVGGFGFSSNVWGKLDNFFTLKTDVMAIVAGPILAADVVGATTFGAVVCSENPSCAQAEQLYQSLIPSIGIDYAGLATAAFSEPSYTAQCLALMGKGADYIQINLTSDGATRLITDCVRQGYTGTFGLADGTVLASAMADTPAEAKVFGVIDGFPWWVEDGPAADFHAAMDAAGLDGGRLRELLVHGPLVVAGDVPGGDGRRTGEPDECRRLRRHVRARGRGPRRPAAPDDELRGRSTGSADQLLLVLRVQRTASSRRSRTSRRPATASPTAT